MTDKVLDKILDVYATQMPDCDYFVIANTLNNTLFDKNLNNANRDEFFSRQEFAEIASAIFDCFGFVNVFYSEQQFINFIMNNQPNINSFVFNYARNGKSEGKKSLIPAFCDLYNIKYSGSDAFVISLLRNKYVWGNLLRGHNIPVPLTVLYDKNTPYIGNPQILDGKKVIAKSLCESASIDLEESNIFKFNAYSLEKQVGILKSTKNKRILIQEYIGGKECEVLVIRDKDSFHAFEPIEIVFNGAEIMSSDISNSYNYSFNCLRHNESAEIVNAIKKYAEDSARILDIKDYARFDFRIGQNKKPYLIDIAGTPYTIKHSSVAYLFTEVYKREYRDIYRCIASVSQHNYS